MRRESNGKAPPFRPLPEGSPQCSLVRPGTSRLLPRGRQWADGARQRTAAKEKQIKSDTHPVCPPHGLCGDQVLRPPGKGARSTGLPLPAGPIRTTPAFTRGRPAGPASCLGGFLLTGRDRFLLSRQKKMGADSSGKLPQSTSPAGNGTI